VLFGDDFLEISQSANNLNAMDLLMELLLVVVDESNRR
jgi:hypothetical protein